ncbi:MAG: YggS family pyridoxal phosphate-dependent enzyme [Thermoguttaceae bacterium]|jgi:pyridoxal phosphate enzyme (YggS family)
MPDAAARIAENVARVHGRIAAAAVRSGRAADAVRLVAVTKYVGPAEARSLIAAGCRDLGESRPQQLWEKTQALAGLPVCWHMIGHLQRNKVQRTVPLVGMIHSVDSLRLAAAIDEAARGLSQVPSDETGPVPFKAGVTVPILLEVNISGEPAKQGFAGEEIEPLLPQLAGLGGARVCGLMCMAALEGGLDEARRDFAALRLLRDRLRINCPGGVSLDELSMGMSGDYEAAIEEGATIVRVGSALFEGL